MPALGALPKVTPDDRKRPEGRKDQTRPSRSAPSTGLTQGWRHDRRSDLFAQGVVEVGWSSWTEPISATRDDGATRQPPFRTERSRRQAMANATMRGGVHHNSLIRLSISASRKASSRSARAQRRARMSSSFIELRSGSCPPHSDVNQWPRARVARLPIIGSVVEVPLPLILNVNLQTAVACPRC
jgi:hypothetical protein